MDKEIRQKWENIYEWSTAFLNIKLPKYHSPNKFNFKYVKMLARLRTKDEKLTEAIRNLEKISTKKYYEIIIKLFDDLLIIKKKKIEVASLIRKKHQEENKEDNG